MPIKKELTKRDIKSQESWFPREMGGERGRGIYPGGGMELPLGADGGGHLGARGREI